MQPLLAVGGHRGVIRVFSPISGKHKCALVGHGGAINGLVFHSSKVYLLLSTTVDNNLRLWNVNTSVCVAIFGGVEGHKDQVISAVSLL